MPIYTYTCPVHQEPVERRVPASEMDNQTCEMTDETRDGSCGLPLQREEIPLTARTPDKWLV